MKITVCPACLKQGETTFCKTCRQRLFKGRRVDHILPFSRPEYNQIKANQTQRISISGAQTKHSLRLNGNRLELTARGGEYILKPIPTAQFENLDQLPANEHLTMQLARQSFGIDAALCALVFFSDGESPAFLTARFDVLPDGTRVLQEDMAQIAQMTEETHGRNYKYDLSYEEVASLLKRVISAYPIEIEKYFRLIIFNYLVHNGDAHLKNFSVFRSPQEGTYTLTPAYDLLNTRLHLPHEKSMALELFRGGFESESYQRAGFHTRDDFMEFGVRIGLVRVRVQRIIDSMLAQACTVDRLIDRSFLALPQAALYKSMVADRVRALAYSPHR